jgi:hypothetical protein
LASPKTTLDFTGFLDAEAMDRFHDLPGHVGMAFLQDPGGKIVVVEEPVDRCTPELGQKVQGGIDKPDQELAASRGGFPETVGRWRLGGQNASQSASSRQTTDTEEPTASRETNVFHRCSSAGFAGIGSLGRTPYFRRLARPCGQPPKVTSISIF